MSELEDQMAEVCETVWGLSLSMNIERLDNEECNFESAPSDGGSETSVSATVHLKGEKEQALNLECSAEVARLAAGVMFDLSQTEVSTEDMCDSVCELVNVIAGNVRGLFEGNTGISTPFIEESSRLSSDTDQPFGQVSFDCHGFPFRVTVSKS